MAEQGFEFEAAAGANTELLAVRVPKAVFEGLEAMATRSKTPLPELVRRLLWYHLAPAVIGQSLRRIRERDLAEVARAQGWYPLIAEYREFTEALRGQLAVMERLRDTVEAGDRKFEELVQVWSSELTEVWAKIAEVEEALDALDTEAEG